METGRDEGPRSVSVIIRSHSVKRINLLKRAIFSVSTQIGVQVELIVTLQRFDAQGVSAVKNAINEFEGKYSAITSHQVVNVNHPETGDIRAWLLNAGLQMAKSKYVCFLDDDDLVYHYAYETLIKSAEKADAALSFGRTVRVRGEHKSGSFHAKNKDRPYYGNSVIDLMIDNFAPIHSYIINREALPKEILQFDTKAPYLEDYRFLLRLIQNYKCTFISMNIDVCEYWFYDNALNTTQIMGNRKSRVANIWRTAYQETERLKGELFATFSFLDIELWSKTLLSQTGDRFGHNPVTDTLLSCAWEVESELRLSSDVLLDSEETN